MSRFFSEYKSLLQEICPECNEDEKKNNSNMNLKKGSNYELQAIDLGN